MPFEKTKNQLLEENAILLRRINSLQKGQTSIFCCAPYKKYEAELKTFQHLLQCMRDPAYLCDNKGNLVFVNSALESASGYKSQEARRHSFDSFLDNENLLKIMEMYSKSLKGKSSECLLKFKDIPAVFSVSNQAIRNRSGAIIAVLGIGKDITKHITGQ